MSLSDRPSPVPPSPTQRVTAVPPSIAGYCMPLFVFGVFTEIETRVPTALYAYVYVSKLAAVMLALGVYRRTLQDVRPSRRDFAPAVLVGLLVCAAWIWLDKWLP